MQQDLSSLVASLKTTGDFSSSRKTYLDLFKKYHQSKREALSQRAFEDPKAACALRQSYADLTDEIIVTLFELLSQDVFQLATPTTSEHMSIVAVGGYGRAEMAPFSDIDLLFLIPYKETAWHENMIETMLYFLWDMGLKVGQSVRTIAECLTLAAEDITIRTSLLEQRHVAGDQALPLELSETLRTKLFDRTVPDFIEQKLEERDKRHQKSGKFRYVLEPNVKEAKGGLRDLQTLYWIGKYMTGAETPQELITEGFYLPEEEAIFHASEDFLWTVRIFLHLLSNRANDILSFDQQVELAQVLGYADDAKRRGVEYFMQDYFRNARQVGELTRVFITALETKHVRSATLDRVSALWKNIRLAEGFALTNGRLSYKEDKTITEHPINMLRLFEVAMQTGYLIHPDAFRIMARHGNLIDDQFRNNKEAAHLFLSLLLDYDNPERVLRRMTEIGLLGEYIPEWKNIDALMQYNMYHSYTVDEHSIQCISILSDIEKGHLEEDLPIASGILKAGVNRRVLYAAVLFHDIGKGQARAHEEIGAELVADICPRLGFEPHETETVIWLVRHHLEMSDAAQKRDLSDPKTITDFVELVGDQEHLDLLTVLTVCDIRGVGPDTWNNWKAMLLRQLHASAKEVLIEGDVPTAAAKREEEAKNTLRKALFDWSEADLNEEIERHYSDYWLGLSPQVQIEIAKLKRETAPDAHGILLSKDPDRDATRVTLVMPDHPGMLARICGAMSLAGANIVDARTYTSADGFATPVLWVQNNNGEPYAQRAAGTLEKTILNVLWGEIKARSAIAERDKIKKREREFKVPTRITFDNDGSKIFTIIEVDTRDRKGLLFDLTRTLAASNISISSAIIATYGEQAVDSFYVKDIFGLKIQAKSKQAQIEAKLLEAIDEGYQDALG